MGASALGATFARAMEHDLSRQHHPRTPARLRELADAAAGAPEYSFDTYGAGDSLQAFEGAVAALLGHEQGCFFATGTAAQQCALHALTTVAAAPLAGRRPVVMVHPTSHLVFHDCLRDGPAQAEAFEAEAAANLPEFEVVRFGAMARVPTFADVEAAIEARWPDVLVLELPQRMNGGGTMAYDDLRRVAALCAERGVRLHCDGARLWEVQPHYRVPLAELGALFDSAYVSFYKGVGAFGCAMLVGSGSLAADRLLAAQRARELAPRALRAPHLLRPRPRPARPLCRATAALAQLPRGTRHLERDPPARARGAPPFRAERRTAAGARASQ